MTLNCAIIDDEPLALNLIKSYVLRTPFLQCTAAWSSAEEALQHPDQLSQLHLVFLDIQMPGIGGMQLCPLLSPQTRIIFTTAFEEYALESYKVNAIDYLLKPISYKEFLHAANKAHEWFQLTADSPQKQQAEAEEFIYVKTDYKLRQIRLKDILYIEGLKDYLKIYIEDEPKPIMTIASLKSMEERLPTPQFMRVHRSFIVQTCKIKTIDRSQIVLGKTRITISDSYKASIMAYLAQHTL